MPTQVTNYKCPACTGPLHFSGVSGKLECDYCGAVYELADIEAQYKEKNEQAAQTAADEEAKVSQSGEDWDYTGLLNDWGKDAGDLRVYSCPSCGAELICDENTIATSCPYCDNPTIVPGKFDGALKPEFVIPFKLEKDDAIKALKEHYKGKAFLPSSFTDKNHIEDIKGIYVPFWLYDGVAEADLMFHATRSTVTRHGNQRITNTDHYDVRRAGQVEFHKIPVDASTKIPDDHMDSIEPYDYSELKEFSSAYLPGYMADKFDVSAESCAARADERAKNTAVRIISNSVTGFSTVEPAGGNVELKRGKVHYALLPVWLLTTKWNNENYMFAMNGQTGKMVGNLPVDKGKYWKLFASIALPIAAVIGVLLFL